MGENELHEYAFDVKLNAVLRVTAESEEEARTIMAVVESTNADELRLWHSEVKLTEFSLSSEEAETPELFEVDGNFVDGVEVVE